MKWFNKIMAWFRPKKVWATVKAEKNTNKDQMGMIEHRTVNLKGLRLVMQFEGLFQRAYKCPAGVWTIGYGTTVYPDGRKVKHGDRCSPKQARDYLQYELNEKAVAVESFLKKIKLDLNDNQFSALVSFAYNLGVGPIVERNRTMGNALRAKNQEEIAAAFLPYCKARVKGKLVELKGLTRRRKAERLLFLS